MRHADDHIHILATTVREDGRRPKLHGSGTRVGDACRQIETDYGLRQLKRGDRTAGKRPTQAEIHKAQRLGWEQTSGDWLQDRIRAAIPHASNAEELLAYFEADGIAIKPRRGPSGDLLGYAAGRPGDLNKNGKQIFHPGGRIAPDLTLPKLKARLETTPPEEHPTARRERATTPWHQATDALDTINSDMTDDTHAQAHITALGELIEATAQKAPDHSRAELRTAARTFARAQRSQIRAEHQAAHTLRHAARDIAHTATGPDGSAFAALLAALVWATIVAARWHEAKNHAHQAEAARQALHHFQTAADHALIPVIDNLAARQPSDQASRTLAHDVRAAVPDHADRILTDPAWPALAIVLADAEAGGHKPHQLLKESAAQRELTSARQPARVLITRIQHTSRDPAPNLRAEAARLRSTVSRDRGTSPNPAGGISAAPAVRRAAGPRR